MWLWYEPVSPVISALADTRPRGVAGEPPGEAGSQESPLGELGFELDSRGEGGLESDDEAPRDAGRRIANGFRGCSFGCLCFGELLQPPGSW